MACSVGLVFTQGGVLTICHLESNTFKTPQIISFFLPINMKTVSFSKAAVIELDCEASDHFVTGVCWFCDVLYSV